MKDVLRTTCNSHAVWGLVFLVYWKLNQNKDINWPNRVIACGCVKKCKKITKFAGIKQSTMDYVFNKSK